MSSDSKWDSLDSDDDDDDAASTKAGGSASSSNAAGSAPQASNEKQTATVKAGFIVQTSSARDKKAVYINVCSSDAVPGGAMSGTASSMGGITANFPYICGDIRTDTDGGGGASSSCYVVELIVHPETIDRATKDRQTHLAVIKTALAVVSDKAIPLDQKVWSLFEPKALRESTGAYFFAPGKLAQAADLGEIDE